MYYCVRVARRLLYRGEVEGQLIRISFVYVSIYGLYSVSTRYQLLLSTSLVYIARIIRRSSRSLRLFVLVLLTFSVTGRPS